jgi:L-lactate dehydrogenase complex protein LldF
MSARIPEFRAAAARAIENAPLQKAIDTATRNFWQGRQGALEELPDSDRLRDHFKTIRHRTLGQLGKHLETFEENATKAGAQVHWAKDAEEARQIIVDIGKRRGVTLATKGKSMASEEIHLSEALEAAGIESVETDLGEWIIQLAKEPPFHIIAPAIHKPRSEIVELLREASGGELQSEEIPELVATARRILRQRFLDAGMGITGGNILVSETGSVVLVTNEGNGRLVSSASPVHVALVGIEKVAPTWDDAAVWLQLLARSATGQPLSVYTTVVTGPRKPTDEDGPEEVHIVLLDNGRSDLLGTTYEEILQCIRCGACLNICPVYGEVGGHTYKSPYSGPIGAVVTPLLMGIESYDALPYASSLCGACKDVCPSRIDLPRMLIELRSDAVEGGLIPAAAKKIEEAAAWVLKDEDRMRVMTNVMRLLQKPMVRDGQIDVPSFLDPTDGRDLPALAERSFRDLWMSGDLEDAS